MTKFEASFFWLLEIIKTPRIYVIRRVFGWDFDFQPVPLTSRIKEIDTYDVY